VEEQVLVQHQEDLLVVVEVVVAVEKLCRNSVYSLIQDKLYQL
jgi:hypothetical protein